jgi:coniferyl-aldehyde dehydrogenase
VLLNVPESANISTEEIFGPVLVIYPYDDVQEVLDYVSSRPSPLAAYWYGTDGADFQRFLEFTTSGGVSRNDGLIHALGSAAPFGGVGNSGTGAYRGKAGFDRLTHKRTVIAAAGPNGVTDGLVGRVLVSDGLAAGVDQQIAGAIADIKTRIA